MMSCKESLNASKLFFFLGGCVVLEQQNLAEAISCLETSVTFPACLDPWQQGADACRTKGLPRARVIRVLQTCWRNTSTQKKCKPAETQCSSHSSPYKTTLKSSLNHSGLDVRKK